MLGHVEVLAAQPMEEAFSPNRSPELAGLVALEGEQVVHGADSAFVQALFGACAHSRQVAESEPAEGLGQNVEGEGDQAVGLFHVAGDLCEVAVGGQAHGAVQAFAHPFADRGLHFAGQFHRGEDRAFAPHQAAGHLVDGADGGDRQAALDSLDDAMVVLGIGS